MVPGGCSARSRPDGRQGPAAAGRRAGLRVVPRISRTRARRPSRCRRARRAAAAPFDGLRERTAKYFEPLEQLGDISRSAAESLLLDRVLHRSQTSQPGRIAGAPASGDVFNELPDRAGNEQSVRHRHVSRQGGRTYPRNDSRPRQSQLGGTGWLWMADEEVAVDGLAASKCGPVADHRSGPHVRDDGEQMVAADRLRPQ